MWRWPSSRTAVVGIAIGVFVVCCLLPVGYLLTVSLSGVGAYSAIALDARQRSLLYNTALLGIGTTLLATAIGTPWASRSRVSPCLARRFFVWRL